LQRLRKQIKAAAPGAVERVSYGIPLYSYGRTMVAAFAYFKNHLSFFAISDEMRKRFARELEPFTIKGKTLQFTVDHPLPAGLVRKLVKTRSAEARARGGKYGS